METLPGAVPRTGSKHRISEEPLKFRAEGIGTWIDIGAESRHRESGKQLMSGDHTYA
jgi:hypothetical protein